jgi:hypothetical protein
VNIAKLPELLRHAVLEISFPTETVESAGLSSASQVGGSAQPRLTEHGECREHSLPRCPYRSQTTQIAMEAGQKKDLAATDKKKDDTPLHVLVEPSDLTLVDGVTGRARRSIILT